MGNPPRPLALDPLDDIDEAITEAALAAFDQMKARGHSDAAAWDVADRVVAGFLKQLGAAE